MNTFTRDYEGTQLKKSLPEKIPEYIYQKKQNQLRIPGSQIAVVGVVFPSTQYIYPLQKDMDPRIPKNC